MLYFANVVAKKSFMLNLFKYCNNRNGSKWEFGGKNITGKTCNRTKIRQKQLYSVEIWQKKLNVKKNLQFDKLYTIISPLVPCTFSLCFFFQNPRHWNSNQLPPFINEKITFTIIIVVIISKAVSRWFWLFG